MSRQEASADWLHWDHHSTPGTTDLLRSRETFHDQHRMVMNGEKDSSSYFEIGEMFPESSNNVSNQKTGEGSREIWRHNNQVTVATAVPTTSTAMNVLYDGRGYPHDLSTTGHRSHPPPPPPPAPPVTQASQQSNDFNNNGRDVVVGVDSMEEHSMHDLSTNYHDGYIANTTAAVNIDPMGDELNRSSQAKAWTTRSIFLVIHDLRFLPEKVSWELEKERLRLLMYMNLH
ncbi:uncharacterized protein TRIADDRAFT_52284 [Trichoplax adhaerens]|uniref:Uncharacterized protein n=1 Tax=Trichoplax adhaerens TaxID=10228 RepID=B3RM97_TRIAD|nr:predicted protein [Trichoplax adhaerens]EDV28923.1 predicted protein [Trichoplax adhaerens]|eukprot:XP_002108125.1 predicted protein [Trichoplax adhaerens]